MTTTANTTNTALDQLADLLDVGRFTVADAGMIPRAIALAAAEELDVPYEDAWTAEEIADSIFDNFAQYILGSGVDGRAATLLAIVDDHFTAQTSRTRGSGVSSFSKLSSDDFTPAKNKLEAVNRISALTGSGPETLGPGSKERKSVLVNLARAIDNNNAPEDATKIELGRWLAQQLGGTWGPRDYSSGYTITLNGLNNLLHLATRRFTGAEDFASPLLEANALVAGAAEALGLRADTDWASLPFDGRTCVEEMFAAQYRNRNQTEWFAWYAEFKVLPFYAAKFKGGPATIGHTEFDYQGTRTWDLKVHSSDGKADRTPLNDQYSVDLAAAQDGVGFIVVNTVPDYTDEDAFYRWHMAKRGKVVKDRKPNSRKLKVAHTVTSIEAYYFPDTASISDAIARGIIKVFNQGRQQDGSPRKPKYEMDMALARGTDYLLTALA
ncbi:hypothetical protein [Corynebacterium sp. HMSC036E10]|uniref:hypothetical protein n=1 Tax=Corynebacterium sp. HMSC036E10 TaxID=1715215 RepID=UPI0009F60BBF|nr:hypothetical protein [Corynebacterium sp. HMSC036E10]